MDSNTSQYCTFNVANLLLGVEVQHVQEVIRYQTMTRVPLAPKAIHGLINLRGQIVTAIDLRCCLELPPRKPDELPMNIVIRDGENAISLLVDCIGDVLEVNDELFEQPPATVRASARRLILGSYKLPDRLLLVLDTGQVLADCESAAMSA